MKENYDKNLKTLRNRLYLGNLGLRIIVDFNEKKRNYKTAAKRTEMLEKFLVANDIEVYGFPSIDDDYHERLLINNADHEQFEKVYVYITKELKAKSTCIHLPYQTLCVNGNGDLEALNEDEYSLSQINEFVQSKQNKQIELPKISILEQNEYVLVRWSGNLLNVKCICCHNQAEYIHSGLSLCQTHYLDAMQKIKEATKQEKDIEKILKENKEEMEKVNKNIEELTSPKNIKPRDSFKQIYE